MERYLTVQGVVKNILKKHEEKLFGLYTAGSKEDWDKMSAQIMAVREVLDDCVIGALPKEKQDIFRGRVRDHYKVLAYAAGMGIRSGE